MFIGSEIGMIVHPYMHLYISKSPTSMRWEESCGFFHTNPLIHPFYLVSEENSGWWFGHHSFLHYILYALHWSLVPVYNDKSERWSWSSSSSSSLQLLLRRRKIHFPLSLFFPIFFLFFFFFFLSTQRTDVGLSKKCWSTRMFVISFQRTHGLHIYTCSSLGKKQSSKGRIYIYIYIYTHQGLPIYASDESQRSDVMTCARKRIVWETETEEKGKQKVRERERGR